MVLISDSAQQMIELSDSSWKGSLRLSWVTSGSLTIMGFIVGLLGCLALTVMDKDQYSQAIDTHCHTRQFLPSISSCIGNNTPQIYLWRMMVAISSPHRFVDAAVHYAAYMHMILRNNWIDRALVSTRTFAFYCRYFCLLLLTYISSTDNELIHIYCFSVHAVATIVSITLATLLHWRLHKSRPIISLENGNNYATTEFIDKNDWCRSLKWKFWLLIAHFVSLAGTSFFFAAHNAWCGDYLYSLFAMCEWVAVFTGIAWHWTSVLDFGDSISLSVSGREIDNKFK